MAYGREVLRATSRPCSSSLTVGSCFLFLGQTSGVTDWADEGLHMAAALLRGATSFVFFLIFPFAVVQRKTKSFVFPRSNGFMF